MRILIHTLILAIAILENFGDSNAMENEGSSSRPINRRGGVRPGSGRPRGAKTRRLDGVFQGQFVMYTRKNPLLMTAEAAAADRDPDGQVEYKGQIINVWRDRNFGIVRTDYPGNHCPRGVAFGKLNYLVRLVDLPDGEKIVECVDEHGILLGVRPWVETTGNYMEPNHSQWFIIHASRIFRVRVDVVSGAVINITLAANDGNEDPQGEPGETLNMAGFKFAVVRSLRDYNLITGAVPR